VASELDDLLGAVVDRADELAGEDTCSMVGCRRTVTTWPARCRPHQCTGVRCPTTSRIERFHKTQRAELLTGRRFESLQHAQLALDAWVADYNFRRPHQAIAMRVPAQRSQPAAIGPIEITRRRRPAA
jgi:hypothetical protein